MGGILMGRVGRSEGLEVLLLHFLLLCHSLRMVIERVNRSRNPLITIPYYRWDMITSIFTYRSGSLHNIISPESLS